MSEIEIRNIDTHSRDLEIGKPTARMKKVADLLVRGCSGKKKTVVVFHPGDPVATALTRGKLLPGKIAKVIPCAQGRCHNNAAAWHVLDPVTFRIMTGWWCHSYKNGESYWRPHSWLVANTPQGEVIVDTVGVASARFGVLLDQKESLAHVNDSMTDADISHVVNVLRPKVAKFRGTDAEKVRKLSKMMADFTNRAFR